MAERPVLLTALILENPLCLSCIAKKTAMTAEAATTALTVIERVLRIPRISMTCPSCGVLDTVYVVKRPVAQGAAR